MSTLTLTANNISASEERGAVIDRFISAVTLSVGDVVYLDSSNLLRKAVGNTTSLAASAIGIVCAANNFYGETSIVAGQWVTVCTGGLVFGFSGLIDWQPLWVDKTTAGSLADVAPSGGAYTYILGNAQGADAIFVHPGTGVPTSV